jgi:hypothetical protein
MFPTFPDKQDVTPEGYQQITDVVSAVVEKACRSKPLPTTLYHYTTPAGFKGIVESGVLRATHISYTNDRVELLHAVEVARLCARDRQQIATIQEEKALLTAVDQNLANTTPFNTLPFAITCFCENGDLLSQWRGYGLGEGGIAIGFEARKIVAIVSQWQGYLAPVLYKDEDQKQLAADLIAGMVSQYRTILTSRSVADHAAHLSDFLTAWASLSTYAGPLFKHRGFAEENEWRLIHLIPNLNRVKFLPKSTHLSPFVELQIGTKRPDQPDFLPITEVWFGPGRYQEHAQHSCGALLSAYGYFNIPLSPSRTPFRSITT